MFSMPGSQKKRRRAVVILHTDFDREGRSGVLEAKSFATELLKSQRELIKIAAESQRPDIVDKIRDHVGKLTVLVRNIPEDLL